MPMLFIKKNHKNMGRPVFFSRKGSNPMYTTHSRNCSLASPLLMVTHCKSADHQATPPALMYRHPAFLQQP
ncbi:hypothetical protein XELAEV_18015019mg [Xenopus laevis]|uniref:Uncharacterized protein n=1 Tax=Xenopus laevis TaxID=8355 RepID=A0A974DJW4_XENLA|nr:hypothetical protein XELAEV_18015019mg [Xenopus laevis]